MTEPLIDPTFLFRVCTPCHYCDPIWPQSKTGLTEAFQIPNFGEMSGQTSFADVRGGWSKKGFSFVVRISGKRQLPWCRETRIEDSDGLQVLIDTRDTHNIHRASRFCHRFLFMPVGSGHRGDEPYATMLKINRSKEEPRTFNAVKLPVATKLESEGYVMAAHIPAGCLNGFEPNDHRRIGFMYAVVDRELGWQTYSANPDFPILEDPSTWGSLELVGG